MKRVCAKPAAPQRIISPAHRPILLRAFCWYLFCNVNFRRAIAKIFGIFFAAAVHAQGIVWTGPVMTFSNAPGADWTQPANQDQLTAQVWLTRSGANRNTRGMFNAAFESGYATSVSPAGTEWAVGSLSNYAVLVYADWATCYGGPGNLANNITSTNAVLHLINEDIYLSIRFTFFGSQGGGFAYERSTPEIVPEPEPGMIFSAGLALIFFGVKKIQTWIGKISITRPMR
jgi:hypothetical protein